MERRQSARPRAPVDGKRLLFFLKRTEELRAAKTRICFASETGVTPRLGGSAGAKLKHALITSIPDREDDIYERKGTRPTIGCLLDNLCIFPLIFFDPFQTSLACGAAQARTSSLLQQGDFHDTGTTARRTRNHHTR